MRRDDEASIPLTDEDDEEECQSTPSGFNSKKVFISYAHKDAKYLDRLVLQLKTLKLLGLVDCWTDKAIVPSSEWHPAIQKAMKDANLFFFLISQDFVASTFIMDEEVPYAIQRVEEGTAQILSIVVRPVNWQALPQLNRFQALPDNLWHVTSKKWEHEDEAWLNVEQGIMKAINGELEPNYLATCMKSTVSWAYQSQSSSSSLMNLSLSSLSKLSVGDDASESTNSTQFSLIGDFYKAELKEGEMVSLKCTLSQYAPLVIGSPFKKREAHLAFRKRLSDRSKRPVKEDEAKINCLLSFTAGQMVWRTDFPGLPWRFLGLYQAIVRNSIPLLVQESYYENVVKKIFVERRTGTVEANVVGKVTRLPTDFTDLYKDETLMNTKVVMPKIAKNQPTFAILIDDSEETSISYRGPSPYLDGDIWVAIQRQGHPTSIYSRFCNLADEADITALVGDLKDELNALGDDYDVAFQFDQVNKRFESKKSKNVADDDEEEDEEYF